MLRGHSERDKKQNREGRKTRVCVYVCGVRIFNTCTFLAHLRDHRLGGHRLGTVHCSNHYDSQVHPLKFDGALGLALPLLARRPSSNDVDFVLAAEYHLCVSSYST